MQRTLCIVVHCTLCTVHWAVFTVYCAQYTVHRQCRVPSELHRPIPRPLVSTHGRSRRKRRRSRRRGGTLPVCTLGLKPAGPCCTRTCTMLGEDFFIIIIGAVNFFPTSTWHCLQYYYISLLIETRQCIASFVNMKISLANSWEGTKEEKDKSKSCDGKHIMTCFNLSLYAKNAHNEYNPNSFL